MTSLDVCLVDNVSEGVEWVILGVENGETVLVDVFRAGKHDGQSQIFMQVQTIIYKQAYPVILLELKHHLCIILFYNWLTQLNIDCLLFLVL